MDFLIIGYFRVLGPLRKWTEFSGQRQNLTCPLERDELNWQASKSPLDMAAFLTLSNRVAFFMKKACRDYYNNLIAENGSDQKKLFRTTKYLLGRS